MLPVPTVVYAEIEHARLVTPVVAESMRVMAAAILLPALRSY
jgi:hypothetical protein